ncbi:MAG TPA: four-carbon acid sugar kinase family protein [Verrucomicrobiae bacterium]
MIGVIADDLSGAAEIGAVGLRHGLSAEIITSGQPSGRADIVCVDTDSRSRTSEEAAERVMAAARLLKDAGAAWIYKKVDSVLRGHVVVEIDALMTALELNRALLVPANPSRARIVRNGRYYVEGRPIQETEFGHDPEHPRGSSKILELLERTTAGPVKMIRTRDSLRSAGIFVGEATKTADLQSWAERRILRTVLAGAAEFFAAVLQAKGNSLAVIPHEPEAVRPERRELFVCGSASKASRNFLREARMCKTPIFSLPSELAWGAEFTEIAKDAVARRAIAAFEQSSRVILNVGLPSMRGPEAARRLTAHLAQLAEAVLSEVEVSHIFAEGGATGAALVQRSGWNRLTVLRELAPGIARLAIPSEHSTVLTIKPGSYDWSMEVRTKIPAPNSKLQVQLQEPEMAEEFVPK